MPRGFGVLRRNDPAFDKNLREYLFHEGSITGREEGGKAGEEGGSGPRLIGRGQSAWKGSEEVNHLRREAFTCIT